MSHFFVGVIIPKFIVDAGENEVLKALENSLAPFDEGLSVNPTKTYIDDAELDDMMDNAGIDADDTDSLLIYVAYYYGREAGYDETGVYYLSIYNPQSKWDWYSIGGRWNGLIKNSLSSVLYGGDLESNITLVDDYLSLIKEGITFPPYALITPEPVWIEKGEMGWFGVSVNDKEVGEWKDQVLEVLEQHKGQYIIGVDCHI